MFYDTRDWKGLAVAYCSKMMHANKPKGMVCQSYTVLKDENLNDTLDVIRMKHISCPQPYA
jgi:hypothetical protein